MLVQALRARRRLKRMLFAWKSAVSAEPSLGGFPSGAVGQFLIKDVVLLRAAIWSLGEALIAKEKPTFEP